MIAVIADDITGAAEMGGLALRYGLHALVSEEVDLHSEPDILIVYTNARSLQKEEAVKLMEGLTKKIIQLNPSLFYKKTDSVLRGHVLAELKAQMKVMGKTKALLVPVNPSLGRAIRKGHYFIHDQLVHETSFSSDPEFPIVDSRVEQMLGSAEKIKVLPKQSPIPEKGICIGEAGTDEDVADWAGQVDETIFPAGGASFFNALLARRFQNKMTDTNLQLSSPLLLVSGTTYKKSVDRIRKFGNLVSYMPSGIFKNTSRDFEAWRDEIISILSLYNKAIVAVGNNEGGAGDPGTIRSHIADVIQLVSGKIEFRELVIEGGSTAYSILNKLGWRSFIPTEELAQGMVRMKVKEKDKTYITIKPGSYEWSSQWNFI